MLFKRVHPVIPCRSKTYIKVPSRGVWKVCKGLTTLASSLYYSALSLLLHFPPFWGRRGCCYCSLLSHSGCSPRGGRAVLLFEKERSFFPPSSNSLTLFHAHTPRSPSLAAASKRESRRFRYFIILLFPFILFSEFFYDSESKKKSRHSVCYALCFLNSLVLGQD